LTVWFEHKGKTVSGVIMRDVIWGTVPVFSSLDRMTLDFRESKCFCRGLGFLMGIITTTKH
jgi:hypothetical protein